MATLQDYYTFSGTSTIGDSYGTGAIVGQSFTAGDSYVLGSIRLKLYRTGTTGDLTVTLTAVDEDGLPIGPALSTGVLAQASIPTSLNVVSIPMSEYNIVGGTKYAIYADYPNHGGPTSLVRFNYTSTAGYLGGSYLLNNGGWAEYTSYDVYFATYTPDTLAKPTTPSPADGAGPGIDWSNWTLGWADGGGATSYSLYAGNSAGSLSLVVASTAALTYTIPEASTFRTLLLDGPVYWRVDASDGSTTVTGDVWEFDPRPAQATYVSPLDGATDQTLHTGAEWDAAAGVETYTFRIIEKDAIVPTVIEGLTATQLGNIADYLTFEWDTTYYWRVDTVNEFGTTEGDQWSFTTVPLYRIIPSFQLINGSVLGPLDGGIEGIDFRWIGDNMMTTVKRLIAAANNRIWYEET